MHPSLISHQGEEFSLEHLRRSIKLMEWKDREQKNLEISIQIRYSDHCYTELIDSEISSGSFVSGNRVFLPERHRLSMGLPVLIEGLVNKPTSRVGITYEKNCHVYKLKVAEPLPQGHRYAVFFRLKKSRTDDPSHGIRKLDLIVESAYVRSNRVQIRENTVFGKIAINTISQK